MQLPGQFNFLVWAESLSDKPSVMLFWMENHDKEENSRFSIERIFFPLCYYVLFRLLPLRLTNERIGNVERSSLNADHAHSCAYQVQNLA